MCATGPFPLPHVIFDTINTGLFRAILLWQVFEFCDSQSSICENTRDLIRRSFFCHPLYLHSYIDIAVMTS